MVSIIIIIVVGLTGISDRLSAQSIPEQDSLALVALYKSTDGDNWHNNANWFETPAAEWFGIETLDNEGRIERLDLTNNNLSGQLPEEIGQFAMIDRLILKDNHLTGNLPESLVNLDNLRRLDLSSNELEDEIPAWLNKMDQLEELLLSGNKLYGQIPNLNKMESLQRLVLSDNELTGPIPYWLEDMQNLNRIMLSNNELTGNIPDLRNLNRLERLELSSNHIDGVIPPWLSELENLRELRLQNINFDPGPIPDLRNLIALEDLRLSDTNRYGEFPNWFSSLVNLERLELDGNQLTGRLPGLLEQFMNLDKLESLNLSNNHLTGQLPEWLLSLEINDLILKEPVGLYLTWQQDPTTTMTIDWHTTPDDEAKPILYYKELGNSEWMMEKSNEYSFPHTDRKIHRVELTGLNPASYYRFRVGEFERLYKFRTMPANLNDPIRFVNGGDTDDENHRMSAVAMKYDPDFIVWGGDLAYEDADPVRVEKLYNWFVGIRENLISEQGRVVPILSALGNHEYFQKRRLLEGDGPHHQHTIEEAREFMNEYGIEDGEVTFFFDLYAFPGYPGYNVLDFGDYLSLVILDSDNYSPIAGLQTQWLSEVLSERINRPHVFPVHHHGAYPSQRNYKDGIHTRIRENWAPLYEEFGVRVVFEHHDHAYKRTFPIVNEKKRPDGVVYFGDGAWGVNPRNRDCCPEAWYINEFASRRHGIVVTLQGAHQHFLVVDEFGQIIDEYPQTPEVK